MLFVLDIIEPILLKFSNSNLPCYCIILFVWDRYAGLLIFIRVLIWHSGCVELVALFIKFVLFLKF